ncbi:MAG TPA: hypothetical protein VHQ64_08520 [Pyrinomonadaceae bacterium]|nr:hypothetical protein [Pyrinomonadaceae bacterium]
MEKTMANSRQVLVALSLFCFLFSTAVGQKNNLKRSSFTITATVRGDRVRIAAPTAVQMRLEVYASDGEKLLDQEMRGGNVFDWGVQDGQGERLSPGAYVCVVTAKNVSGQLIQKIGAVTLSEKFLRLQSADRRQLSPRQSAAIGPMEEKPSWTVEGEDARQTDTTSELANPMQGLGKPLFRFANFVVEPPSAGAGSGAERRAASLFPFTGTTNHIAKFIDNSGTLGDSTIQETSDGKVGIGYLPSGTDTRFGVTGLIKFDSTYEGTYIGEFTGTALAPAATGSVGNTAVGTSALRYVTSGGDDTALGANALKALTTGNYDTSLGVDSSLNMSTAYANTAVGKSSLYTTTTGSQNTAVGAFSMWSNTTGGGNTAVGVNSLYSNADISGTAGTYNTAVGWDALYSNVSGTQSVAVGAAALQNSTGSNNVAIGTSAGASVTSGTQNVIVGTNAGTTLTSGSHNYMVGYGIEFPSATASNQLNIGNLIYGTGVDGSGTTVSSGNVGIGTNSPNAKLQVTSGDVYVQTQGKGIILRATDGSSCFRVTVNNAGTLSASSVTCP